jgi:hypothetical protein
MATPQAGAGAAAVGFPDRAVRWARAALALLLAVPAAADAEGGIAAAAPGGPLRAGMRDWYAFPGAFYTPETHLGVVAVGGVHFGLGPGLATSSAELILYYTQLKQADATFAAMLHPTSSLLVDWKMEASVFPGLYYGIGNRAPASADESYTNRYLDLKLAARWEILGLLRAGPKVHLRREVAVKREAGGSLEGSGLPGAGDWGGAGVGPSFSWDSRDDRFQPRQGFYAEAAYLFYPASLVAGAGAFGRGGVDLRWYLGPLPGHAVAFQLKLEGSRGAVPVTLLPAIGGNDFLRGYVSGRYRDLLAASGQVEWRFPIAGRFRGTAFAGLGTVGRDLPDLGSRPPRFAGGLGLRYRLTATGAYLRFDAAYGEDGLQIYFLTMEAF